MQSCKEDGVSAKKKRKITSVVWVCIIHGIICCYQGTLACRRSDAPGAAVKAAAGSCLTVAGRKLAIPSAVISRPVQPAAFPSGRFHCCRFRC